MADRPYQFVSPMMRAMESLKYTLGTDIMMTNKELYNAVLMLLSLQAMTLKILQDLNPAVVTDAALQLRLDTAIDTGPGGDRSGWPGWLVLGVSPSLLAQYGATETDSPDVLRAKIDAYNTAHP